MKNPQFSFNLFTTLCCSFIITLFFIILYAWANDSVTIIELMPNNQLANPVTSICFILISTAILLRLHGTHKFQLAGRFIILLCLTISTIKIIELLAGVPTGIDNWLFSEKLVKYGNEGMPNLMAPNTSIVLFLLSSSIILARYRIANNKALPDYFALAALIISFLSVLGYLYNAIELFGVKSSIPMAFPTAFSFMLLSLCILLLRSDVGIFNFFTKDLQGSKMARRLIPVAIVLPILLGVLRLYGQDLGLYTLSFGVSLFATSNILIFVLFICKTSISLNKSQKTLINEMGEKMKLNEQITDFNTKLEKKVNDLTKEKINQQKLLMQATIAGQEKEKKQIGMELHDNINQILASTKLYLEIGKEDTTLSGFMIEKAITQLTNAIEEIRRLSKDLVPHGIEERGIIENLNHIIEPIRASRKMQIDAIIPESLVNFLNKDQQIAIFRIIQEQINNILKHANADFIFIEIKNCDGFIELVIKDNGKGFDMDVKKLGIGLSNIKSRVEVLEGELEINSSAGNGCKLKIRFPVNSLEFA